MVSINAEGEWIVEKEFLLLGKPINELIWTDDGEHLIACGEGDVKKCNGIKVSNTSTIGDIFGHDGNIIAAAITAKPHTLISAGEGKEMLMHPGMPFKGQGTRIDHGHTKDINRIKISPDGSKFASVSGDKLVNIYDTEKFEKQKSFQAHKMGIYDLLWIDNETIATCSADNKVKTWNVED